MSQSLIKAVVDEALQSFDRTQYSNAKLPASLWVNSQRKVYIEVPIYLYSEFGLNPQAMPDDSLDVARRYGSKPGARAYRNATAARLPSRFPRKGNEVTLQLPKTSQIMIKRRGGDQKLKKVSFVVPRYVNSSAVAFFLWNCCDKSKLPHLFGFNQSEFRFDYLRLYKNRSFVREIYIKDMTVNDLGIIDWVEREQNPT